MNVRVPPIAEYSRAVVAAWNGLVTSLYKLAGFVVLTLILTGLVCYFAVHLFYLASNGWVAPVILSAHHERVMQVNSHALQQAYQRDKLEAERLSHASKLATAEHAIALLGNFQADFDHAVSEELAARERFLAEATRLERQHRESQTTVARANDAFVGVTEPELERQYQAGLVDRASYVQARRGLASIAQAELALRDRTLELSSAVSASRREIQAMQATLGKAAASAATAESYDVLLMRQELHRSIVEAERLKQERDNAERMIALLDAAIERHDQLLAEVETSPYRRALDQRVVLAFAPYENLDRARPGQALFGCSLGLVWCRRVGAVVRVLDGEVTVQHPLYNELVRGLMIEIEFEQGRWAEEKALHLGRPPLFI